MWSRNDSSGITRLEGLLKGDSRRGKWCDGSGGVCGWGWSFGVRGFLIGVERRRVEKNRGFRGRATINGVAQLEGLSEGIFFFLVAIDCATSPGRKLGGCLFERGYRGSERRSRKKGVFGVVRQF